MKAIQQHQLDSVSGGCEVWRPSLPAPAPWGSPMDGEWVWLLEELPARDPIEPVDPPTICPPIDEPCGDGQSAIIPFREPPPSRGIYR